MQRYLRLALVLLLLPLVAHPSVVGGQEETPEAISVAAGELDNPRGFLVNSDEAFFVASAGRGGDQVGAIAPIPDAPLMGGRSAEVTLVQAGCASVLAGRLPSTVGATGRTWGAADVAVLDDQLYVLVAGGGAAHGNPRTPNGVYRIDSDGSTEIVADLGEWLGANPVASPRPLDRDPDGMPASMATIGAELWVVEANGGQILRVAIDGTIGRVVDLSASRLVLTDIIASPSGGALVATMGTASMLDRTAKVIDVSPQGAVADVWTGLTAVVGIASGVDGTLYALETATGSAVAPSILTRRSGRVLRQTGPDTREVVVRRLDVPTAMAAGVDGLLYIAVPGEGRDGGAILRVDPTVGEVLTAPRSPFVGPTCDEDAA